jgi:hypothetical protein
VEFRYDKSFLSVSMRLVMRLKQNKELVNGVHELDLYDGG